MGIWSSWSLVKKIRVVLAVAAGLYLAKLFVPHGWDKFDPEGFWSGPFERWGYPAWLRNVIGVLETGGGIGLLIPWVAPYAGVTLFFVMCGAFYTRWGSGFNDLTWIAMFGLGSLWVGFEWREFAIHHRRTSKSSDSD